MDFSQLLLALLYAAAVALFSKIVARRRRRPATNLPPGPKPWPIIGNLNLLGSLPHESLHNLSQNYGEIMLLKFGRFPVVVASSPRMAEQFLKVHDAVFASRPALAAGKYVSYDNSDISFSPYGPYWREARKICISEMLSPNKLDSWEQIRVEERRSFLSRLRSQSGKPVLLRDELLRYSLTTVCRFMFGRTHFVESETQKQEVGFTDEVLAIIGEWFLLNGAFNIGDWIPWLSVLDLQGYVKRMKALRKKMDKFYDNLIDDRLARRSEGEDYANKDFLDVLLQIGEDPNAEIELKRDCIKALIMTLLAGGTDTAASAVQWAIHEILKQPRIIEKAKSELNGVIGGNRWVEENDFARLPYVDAIIMETFRLHPLGTILAPHYAMEDCNVAGYDISKGTMVIVNAWSIQRDPNLWDAPEEFVPERFMGKEINMTGSNFALLPFGSGRRRCVAYNLGLKTVRTTLANLLHGFELKLVEGMRPEDVSMEEQYGLSTHPKHPLSIIFEPETSKVPPPKLKIRIASFQNFDALSTELPQNLGFSSCHFFRSMCTF